MAHRRVLTHLALAALTVLPLGAIGCSEGSHSPTEPAAFTDPAAPASSSSPGSVSAESRGGDDNASGGNGGRGQGGDDNNRNRRGGRTPRDPQPGQQFAGAVSAANGNSLRLAGGVRVTVNAQTQWNARGDLFSVSAVASSLAGGHAPRVEGRGARQADGSILAQSIKAEDNR